MTEAEFRRAGEILSILSSLEFERDLWLAINAENPNGVTYTISKRPMSVPTNLTLLLRNRVTQDLDTRIAALRAEFNAL